MALSSCNRCLSLFLSGDPIFSKPLLVAKRWRATFVNMSLLRRLLTALRIRWTFRAWSVSQPALALSMGTVSSAKQVSFSSTSSGLFAFFIKRKSSQGTPAVELWSKKQFCLLGNVNTTPLGSHNCHLPSPPLNRACEGKWNRNVAQALTKERKEFKKKSSVLSSLRLKPRF